MGSDSGEVVGVQPTAGQEDRPAVQVRDRLGHTVVEEQVGMLVDHCMVAAAAGTSAGHSWGDSSEQGAGRVEAVAGDAAAAVHARDATVAVEEDSLAAQGGADRSMGQDSVVHTAQAVGYSRRQEVVGDTHRHGLDLHDLDRRDHHAVGAVGRADRMQEGNRRVCCLEVPRKELEAAARSCMPFLFRNALLGRLTAKG
jgi:hypothetical protein